MSDIPCCECGGPVVEFSIPNELWNRVMRPDGHETDKEYLCYSCWNKALVNYFRGYLASKLKAREAMRKAYR